MMKVAPYWHYYYEDEEYWLVSASQREWYLPETSQLVCVMIWGIWWRGWSSGSTAECSITQTQKQVFRRGSACSSQSGVITWSILLVLSLLYQSHCYILLSHRGAGKNWFYTSAV